MTFPEWYIIVHKPTGKFLPHLDPPAFGYTQHPPVDMASHPKGPRRFDTYAQAERALKVYCRGEYRYWNSKHNAFAYELEARDAKAGFLTSINLYIETTRKGVGIPPRFRDLPNYKVDGLFKRRKQDPSTARPISEFEIRKATLHW